MQRYRSTRRWRSNAEFRANDGKSGVVYILKNHAFPHLLKIGQSTRSAYARAEELNKQAGTGSPGYFVVVFQRRTADCGRAERRVFRALSKHRFQNNREFFEIDEATAKSAIEKACDYFDSIAEQERQLIAEQRDVAPTPRAHEPATDLPHSVSSVVTCIGCSQKLRVPSNRNVEATCPKCRAVFDVSHGVVGRAAQGIASAEPPAVVTREGLSWADKFFVGGATLFFGLVGGLILLFVWGVPLFGAILLIISLFE